MAAPKTTDVEITDPKMADQPETATDAVDAQSDEGQSAGETLELTSVTDSASEVASAPVEEDPDLADINAWLQEAKATATTAKMSEREVDGLVAELKTAKAKLQFLQTAQAARQRRVDQYDPLASLDKPTSARLIKRGVLPAAYPEWRTSLAKLGKQITELQPLVAADPSVSITLGKLGRAQQVARQKVAGFETICRQTLVERRTQMQDRISAHRAPTMMGLAQRIAEIEANPRVQQRLQVLTEQEQQRAAAEQRQEQAEVIARAAKYIEMLLARHGRSFQLLSELAGQEHVEEQLISALRFEDDKRKQRVFGPVHGRLIEAVIDGQGSNQLTRKKAEVMVPWATREDKDIRPRREYDRALQYLRDERTKRILQTAAKAGNGQALDLVVKCGGVLDGNAVIGRLTGREKAGEKNGRSLPQSAFWGAFSTRDANDKNGETQRRAKARAAAIVEKELHQQQEAKRAETAAAERAEAERVATGIQAALEEVIAGVVSRGGFQVQVPVEQPRNGRPGPNGKPGRNGTDNGASRKVETRLGAVRLEIHAGPKGKYYKIVEAVGAAAGALNKTGRCTEYSADDGYGLPGFLRALVNSASFRSQRGGLELDASLR